MQAHMRSSVLMALLAYVLVLGFTLSAAQQQQQQQQDDKQRQQQQDQKAKDKKNDPKGTGGLFGGMKAVTSMKSSSETQLVDSGGAKGVGPGDGKKIAAAKPTADDRQKVDRMASAAPSPEEMKQFLEQGRLSTEKKGGK